MTARKKISSNGCWTCTSKLAASVQATSHKPLHLQATSSHRYCTDSHPLLAHMPRQRLWLCSAWHCQPFLPTPVRCDVGWKNCEGSLLCHVNPINKPACQNPRRHPHVAHGLDRSILSPRLCVVGISQCNVSFAQNLSMCMICS